MEGNFKVNLMRNSAEYSQLRGIILFRNLKSLEHGKFPHKDLKSKKIIKVEETAVK